MTVDLLRAAKGSKVTFQCGGSAIVKKRRENYLEFEEYDAEIKSE